MQCAENQIKSHSILKICSFFRWKINEKEENVNAATNKNEISDVPNQAIIWRMSNNVHIEKHKSNINLF